MKKYNMDITLDILHQMPESKKELLRKALIRNSLLTSAYLLSECTLTIYKEGWLVKLEGTRSTFTVFAKDNDGEFEFIRKPNENKLHKLYTETATLTESHFEEF